MSKETPLVMARHLHTQMVKSLTLTAARLLEVRTFGIAGMKVCSLNSGGLVLIQDEHGNFRFSSPYDTRVAKATADLARNWNKNVAGEHDVKVVSLGKVLEDHIVATALLINTIDKRITTLEEQES